jgi:hypothetical protein
MKAKALNSMRLKVVACLVIAINVSWVNEKLFHSAEFIILIALTFAEFLKHLH